MNKKRFLKISTESGEHHFVILKDIKKADINGTKVSLFIVNNDWNDWVVTENVSNVDDIANTLENELSDFYPSLLE